MRAGLPGSAAHRHLPYSLTTAVLVATAVTPAPAGGRSRTMASTRGYASVTCSHNLLSPASLSKPCRTITPPHLPGRATVATWLLVGVVCYGEGGCALHIP